MIAVINVSLFRLSMSDPVYHRDILIKYVIY